MTDDQFPPCIDRSIAERFNIGVVDHKVVFDGFSGVLPTFNSLSIETVVWRIPDLAEQFIYLNDDMFFTAETVEDDFFWDGRAVLRGSWANLSGKDPSFHGGNQLEAAKLFGFDGSRFFRNHHIPYPMLKSVMSEAFEDMLPHFARNMAFRFRDRSQFWPISLHAYRAFATDRGVEYAGAKDWQHFSVRFCKIGSVDDTYTRLNLIRRHQVKMACMNYFEAVEAKVPDAIDYVSEAAGDPAPFERTGAGERHR